MFVSFIAILACAVALYYFPEISSLLKSSNKLKANDNKQSFPNEGNNLERTSSPDSTAEANLVHQSEMSNANVPEASFVVRFYLYFKFLMND